MQQTEADRNDAMPTRRGLLRGAAACALTAAAAGPDAAQAALRPIPFGSAAEIDAFRSDARYREALKRYCDVIVPMNDLKWQGLRHDRPRFDFSGADEIVAFAQANRKALRGHTLLWGDALPPWAKEMTTRAEAERELVNHIEIVVDRYKGRIATWDVVNEVIRYEPSPDTPLRDTIWQRLLGPEHIEIAFRTAARVDPKARLVLNDFLFEEAAPAGAARRKVALDIFRRLRDKGIPVHGLGIQAHLYGEKDLDLDGLQRFLRDLDALGLDVEITELDVIDWKLPADPVLRDKLAAARVSSFLEAVVAAKRPKAIVTWGLTDRYSWVPDTFPRQDSARARPLPLDTDYRPKPMMAVLERFRRGTA
ncbi:endo-1,4-beta-xylanase [Bosea sp. BH3]|uniref:endo-1,4-beta-xylanase n=1 Tax=Bosea sp. BH3 TaxID=2871701 RepID=UPI0021CB4169|nr:endo-1,4-beta-xylanase [Bosea sp. BH3]MCU4181230.1 endo-1,4-beta-xylanase [Bosea sp. BH3]